MPSLLTAACAGVLIAASAGGRVWLAVALCVVQVALVAGWFVAARLMTLGERLGAVVAAAGAVVADVTLLRTSQPSQLRGLAGVLAAVVGLAFVVQLARRDGRSRLTAALAATVGAGALALAGAVLLGVRGGRGGVDVVAVALVAVGIGMLPVQARVPLWASMPVGLIVGTGVGYVLSRGSSVVGAGAGVAIAVAAVAVGLAARAGVSAFTKAGAAEAAAALPVTSLVPLAVAAPVVLVVARIMVG